MGFLSNGAMMGIGQGLNQGADNFLKLYMFKQQQAQEAQRLAQQKALQEAQIEEHRAQGRERDQRTAELQRKAQEDAAMRSELAGLYSPKSAQDMAFTPGAISGGGGQPAVLTPEGEGMMTGQPTTQQLMGVLGKYEPKATLTAQVSMANTEEKLKAQREIFDERTKAAAQRQADEFRHKAEMLEKSLDARAQALADQLRNAIEKIEVTYGLKKELQDAQEPKDKSQEALAKAQQAADREIAKKYTKSFDGQWMADGVPIPQKTVKMEWDKLVQRNLGGKGKTETNADPFGLR